MNPLKAAILAGLKTPREVNRHLREQYNHQKFKVVPYTALSISGVTEVLRAWANRDFIAALYRHREQGFLRLTINRLRVDDNGDWVDGITWDDLMWIKSQVGFGDKWATELFPPDKEVVNVANMRHLVLQSKPPLGWWDKEEFGQVRPEIQQSSEK